MLRPTNFKLGMMIGHDQQITPFGFGVKGSKVKVKRLLVYTFECLMLYNNLAVINEAYMIHKMYAYIIW
jgi:hypothetical protein